MLAVRRLSIAFGSKIVLDDASVVIDDTDRCALVGDNGAGKSTLLSMLAGQRKADHGVVERGRGQTLAWLLQEPDLDLDLTARDIAASTGREPWEIDEALSRLSIVDVDRPIRHLSGGQRRRVDLARVLLQDADILLLDEPTNHLDTHAIAWLVERLKKHRGPIIITSHDRAFVDDVCTRVVELNRGKLHVYAPPADGTSLTISFVEQKIVRDEITVKTQHKKERLWLRELAWLRAGTPARTTKQTARIERAGELQEFVESEADAIRKQQKMVRLDGATTKRLGKTIIEMRQLGLVRGGRPLFSGFDLIVTRGQRWGIVGDNGAGKTSLLLAILTACGHELEEHQRVLPASGELIVGINTKIAVFDQHRRALDPEETLEEVLAADNDHVFLPKAADGTQVRLHVASYLERFLFDGSDRRRRTKTLSGGEQNRLVLAKLFLGDQNVLLLDEPTNDLDVTTLGVLEEAVASFDGCVFVVSHDRRFLDRVCTGILAFEKKPDGTSTVTPVVGDWTHYLRTQSERVTTSSSTTAAEVAEAKGSASSTSTPTPPPAPPPPPSRVPVAPKKKRTNKEQREFDGIEKAVQDKEARRDELRTQLLDGDWFRAHPKEARQGSDELLRLEGEIEHLYARWQLLADLAPM